MRNLKRALSLVMAAAMLIGMMVVSASAGYEDFTDKDEIQNTEAVSTLVSLGVISGKEDGSYFDPTGIVTRAEMAKLIAVSLNGGKDPILGSGAATTQFTDTKGHWAEAYIAYCANLGIINGKGDGTFGPNEQVTGTAAAKMFLVALGYRTDIEKLTGTGWDLNSDTLANKIGLYNGLDTMLPSNGLTRDNVAQLIYNGIQADEVVYRNNYGEYSGVIYAQPNGTMLSNRFGVYKVTGIVVANEYFGLDQVSTKPGKTMLQYAVKNNLGNYVTADIRYNVTTSADMLGKEVVIYVKPTSKLNPNPVEDVVLGDAIVTAKNTVFTTNDELVDDATKGNDVTKALKNNGLKLDEDVEAFVNYDGISDVTSASEAADLTGRGYTTTFIDNTGDGKVDMILFYHPSFGKVSVYSEAGDGKISVNRLSSDNEPLANKTAEEVVGFENVAKGDYVFYTYIAEDATYYVEKAEPTTVTVTSIKRNDALMKETIVADGETYKLSAIAGSKIDGTNAKLSEALKAGKDAVLYLDVAGNVVYVTDVDKTVSYLVITDVAGTGDFSDTLKAKVILSDGTATTVAVSKIENRDVVKVSTDDTTEIGIYKVNGDAYEDGEALTTLTSDIKSEIYSYTVDADGNYELKTCNALVGEADVKNNTPAIDIGANTVIANTTTPIIVKGNGSPVLYTGINNVATKKGATVLAVTGDNDLAKVVFVLGGDGDSDALYMYILSATPSEGAEDGDPVYTYDVVRDGEQTTIVGKSASMSGDGLQEVKLSGGKLEGTYGLDADNRITALNGVTIASNGVLSDGDNTYYYNDETVVIKIEDGAATTSSIDEIVVAQGEGVGAIEGDTLSILLVKKESSTALYVFIEEPQAQA